MRRLHVAGSPSSRESDARKAKQGHAMAEERITTLPTATAISTTEAEWYVIHGGEELGPLSLAALVEKAVAGDIEADDLVKQTGGLWTKASDLRFIQDARTDGDRQRRQLFPVKDSMQDAREGAGEKASQVAKGMVRPAAWVIFAIGGVLFVL